MERRRVSPVTVLGTKRHRRGTGGLPKKGKMVGDRTFKLPSSPTSGYGRYAKFLPGGPVAGPSPYRPSTGPLFGPHDVLERSGTYPYVPMH